MTTRSVRRLFLSALGMACFFGLGILQAGAQPSSALLIPHPDWDCYMPEGIPVPESGELIFELEIPLDRSAEIGITQYGDRSIAVGQQGTVSGPKLSGKVMEGALDYALTLANGTVEIEQILVFQAEDESYIYVRNAGVGAGTDDIRIVMDFEAPNESAHAWLNTGRYVARRTLDTAAAMLTMSVYDVSGASTSDAGVVRISKPSGVAAQPWDYRVKDASEQQGEELIVENVELAPSQSVGPSKRGPRNIIPITGGQLSGRISGKVLMGGADYQNLGRPATIDARYLWQADDGEIIIVRNAGAFGQLVPYFEARIDGPYAYLNEGLYLSSNPGMGQGGVSLTFYESQD